MQQHAQQQAQQQPQGSWPLTNFGSVFGGFGQQHHHMHPWGGGHGPTPTGQAVPQPSGPGAELSAPGGGAGGHDESIRIRTGAEDDSTRLAAIGGLRQQLMTSDLAKMNKSQFPQSQVVMQRQAQYMPAQTSVQALPGGGGAGGVINFEALKSTLKPHAQVSQEDGEEPLRRGSKKKVTLGGPSESSPEETTAATSSAARKQSGDHHDLFQRNVERDGHQIWTGLDGRGEIHVKRHNTFLEISTGEEEVGQTGQYHRHSRSLGPTHHL